MNGEIQIDGVVGAWVSDGISDQNEFSAFGTLTPIPPYADIDKDGYYNFADLDSDGDKIVDTDEDCNNPASGDCDVLDPTSVNDVPDDAIGITPNNDGLNDAFYFPVFSSKKDANLKVFNRWGQVVFEKNPYASSGEEEAWKGTNEDGDPLPVGTYYYLLEYTNLDNKKQTLSNYIYISR